MSSVSPISSKSRSEVLEHTIRHECRSLVADAALPIPPSVLPPTPSTPPFSTPAASSLRTPTHLTLSSKESARFPAGSSAYSRILSSTPYSFRSSSNSSDNDSSSSGSSSSNNDSHSKTVRKSTPSRRASSFPLIIPTELTLSIVRESPLTAVEELTCGDHHVDGKEDSVSSTRAAEASAAAITKRQCAAFGTPRETSVAAGVVATTAAAAVTAAAAAAAEGIPKPEHHTMGACASKQSSSTSKNADKSSQAAKVEKPATNEHRDGDDVNDEEDPAHLPKFKLKRDSIAVTKVRLMKTQAHQQQNTIGEEEEVNDDDDDEHDDSGRGEDHVHFDNHVSKQSIPNDSGVSLDSCPDNDHDVNSIRFRGKLDYDSANEISLASNVTLRSLRKERIVDDENRSFDFKTIRERAEQLLESRTEHNVGSLRRASSCKKDYRGKCF